MKQPYTIEPARTIHGIHPTMFKVASGQRLILPEWMFTREQAEAVCAAMNEAYRRGVGKAVDELVELLAGKEEAK